MEDGEGHRESEDNRRTTGATNASSNPPASTVPSVQPQGAAEATPAEEAEPAILTPEILELTNEQLAQRIRLIDNDVRALQQAQNKLQYDVTNIGHCLKDNLEKIKLNKQLPYLVANVVELSDASEDPTKNKDGKGNAASNTGEGTRRQTNTVNQWRDMGGGALDTDSDASTQAVVIRTSTRQTIYLPAVGLVPASELKPNDLVGVNKDSYLILDKLPPEYDSRVKAMEVDEKPQEQYSDIGGLDKQIQELIEAVVLPMTHKERFDKIGIKPPKGVLMHGPPGTGKTLLARACAAQTKATFLKLAGPQLVQMFIGDGSKLVRDAFDLAKEKSPSIIFIDELDAIGAKRQESELSGDREVQRTMLELLNQLDGFSSDDRVKVIAATNRPDTLDPALLRSGRLDRKIELPHPNEEARARILGIHSRKMNVNKNDVNFEELARATDDFNGAQLKAVCVEAGMIALRRGAAELQHEDFVEGIGVVQAKKKAPLIYFA